MRNDRGMNSHDWTGDADTDVDILSCLGDPSECAPDEGSITLCADLRVIVVRNRCEVEADLFGACCLSDEIVRSEFLARQRIADVGHCPLHRDGRLRVIRL